MEIFDNITKVVRDDLKEKIKPRSKVSIAAACFSMYAYKELKNQLEKVDEFRFIFTSPTFIKEKAEKQKREFYIPRLSRENSLYGTEFEIKLRNEMTQKAIARECAEWIRKKATFKSNVTGENMGGFMTVDSPVEQTAYMPINGFTTVDIGCERGNNSYNMVNSLEAPFSTQYMQLFETLWNDKEKMQDVTEMIISNISTAYNENSPEFIYFMTLYNVFSEFLDDISEDVLPNEATGFKQSKIWSMLYDFQRDAVLAIINKLEKYNGCILADSVGLGKTFTALAVIKYYENRKPRLPLYDKARIEQITGLKMKERDTKLNKYECTEYFNYDTNTSDYNKVSFYVFDDISTANKVYKQISKSWFNHVTDEGDNYIQGWLDGVCDASVEAFVYVKGNLIIYTEMTVQGCWECDIDDYSPSTSYVHDLAQFKQKVMADF